MVKFLGGGKLNIPVVELMLHVVEGVRVLCEETRVSSSSSPEEGGRRKEGGEDQGAGGSRRLTPQGLDVGGVYSSGQGVEMLLSYLPLFKTLFTLLMTSFRKVQAHVSMHNGEHYMRYSLT